MKRRYLLSAQLWEKTFILQRQHQSRSKAPPPPLCVMEIDSILLCSGRFFTPKQAELLLYIVTGSERERESYVFLPVPVAEAAPIDLVSLKGNAEPTVESQLPPPSTAFRQFSLPNPPQNVDHFSSPLPSKTRNPLQKRQYFQGLTQSSFVLS